MRLLLLSVFFLLQPSISSYIDIIDIYNRDFNITFTRQITEESVIVNDSRPWEPLRIQFQFVNQTDQQPLELIIQYQEIAAVFLQKHLLVRRQKENIIISESLYQSSLNTQYQFSSNLINKTYDTDLVFLVVYQNDSSSSALAAAAYLQLDVLSYRPIIGVIMWNLYKLNVSDTTEAYFESRVSVLIHEMLHGLGFHPYMINNYYDSVTGQKYNDSFVLLKNETNNIVVGLSTPRLLAYAQNYFGCHSMKGVALEQQGVSGSAYSHWERSLLYNEIMTASYMNENFVITDFTFSLLEDTGFYRLAQYTPDILTWGKNQGCDFIENTCQNTEFNEFCQISPSLGCAITHGGIGICQSDPFSDNCKYEVIQKNTDCRDGSLTNSDSLFSNYNNYYGYDSMCLEGGFTTSDTNKYTTPYTCNQYTCSSDNKLTILINGQNLECSDSANVTLPGYNGYIICPSNTERFCQNTDECPNQCNKRGFCMKGTCTCMGQYYGIGCEKEGCLNFKNGFECVLSCPTNTYLNSDINYCIGCPGNCKTCSNYNSCTECQDGYQLRGGFCDYLNAKILSFMISLILIALFI